MTRPAGFFWIEAGITTDVVVTGLGFKPTVVQLVAADHATIRKSLGTDYGPGVDNRAGLRSGVVAGESIHEYDDYSILTNGVKAKIKSLDSDGFTVEVAVNASVSWTLVQFLAFD